MSKPTQSTGDLHRERVRVAVLAWQAGLRR